MSKKSRRKVIKKSKKNLLHEKLNLALVAGLGFAALIVGMYMYLANFPGPNYLSPTDERLVRRDSHVIGNPQARITIVEFVDLTCIACAKYNSMLKLIMEKYEGRVNLVVRHLPQHENSLMAAKAVEAAALQGHFWEMENLLLLRQEEWKSKDHDFSRYLSDRADELGLVTFKFSDDLSSKIIDQKIERDADDAKNLGVRSTPTFFVNGRKIHHASWRNFEEIINKDLFNQSYNVSFK